MPRPRLPADATDTALAPLTGAVADLSERAIEPTAITFHWKFAGMAGTSAQ
jgi:hypothetical protein